MTLDAWRAEIERRLDAVRPDRYHKDDRSWMEPVIQWAVEHAPAELRASARWGTGPADEEEGES